jgi:hypothetical protein
VTVERNEKIFGLGPPTILWQAQKRRKMRTSQARRLVRDIFSLFFDTLIFVLCRTHNRTEKAKNEQRRRRRCWGLHLRGFHLFQGGWITPPPLSSPGTLSHLLLHPIINADLTLFRSNPNSFFLLEVSSFICCSFYHHFEIQLEMILFFVMSVWFFSF